MSETKKKKTRATQKPPEQPRLPSLTHRQAEVLQFIAEGCDSDSIRRSPTVRKVAARFGIAKSTAYQHIVALKDLGCINGEPDRQRSLSMTVDGRSLVDLLATA